MDKPKTLKRHKKSLIELSKSSNSGIKRSKPREYLLDEDNIARGILECLNNNDPEGVMEVIHMYLEAVNKSQFLKQASVPRSTMYTAFKSKNPTIKTIARLMSARHRTLPKRRARLSK